MRTYLNALRHILDHGTLKESRTGIDTKSVFGMQMRFNLQEGFPILTTKKMAIKAIISELLWFLEGSGDERRLAEILHGTRDESKQTIWTANANADYWKNNAKYPGDLGRVYGVQWRHWQTGRKKWISSSESVPEEVDQIQTLIDGIKKDPNGRRHIITAWNPAELHLMALPPCHLLAQFDVTGGHLNCLLYQRSCDMFLGVPFNIASYALLTHIIARECDLEVGEFVWTGGDCHIYTNHYDAVNEQLSRDPRKLPELSIAVGKSLGNYTLADFELIDYDPMPAIKAEMAV